jgi:hypothetical protein
MIRFSLIVERWKIMPKYARPRLTLVVDADVAELVKQLADLDQRPPATFASMVFSELIRDMAAKRGLLGKQKVTSDRKT